MLFIADEGVADEVLRMLRRFRHQAHRSTELGLAGARDEELAVAVDERRGVLITHDREFSVSRMRNVWGRHVWLRCKEWDAAEVLARHLEDIRPILERKDAVVIELRRKSMTAVYSSQRRS